jgi:peptide/nickel transport system permease protein
MFVFIVRRVLYVVPIALGVSIICFMLIYLAPGDPASAVIPDNTPPEIAQQIRQAYGFDQPVPVQYLRWLGRVMVGDFGQSLQTRRDVLGEIGPAMANTAKLAACATIIGCLIGMTLGMLAAYRDGRLSDRAISAAGISSMSVPQYWLGMVLVVVLAVDLGWLPASGMGDSNSNETWLELGRHLVMPVITLAVVPVGIISRSARANFAEVLRRDYVQTLYAKGLRPSRILLHVLKNGAPPTLSVIGLEFARLFGGSILVETVFSWPGTGALLNSAIFTRDLPVIQGTVLVLAMFFVVMNLLVDILQMLLDPRFRLARAVAGG